MAAKKPVMISELASTLSHVPSNFIRPIGDRPNHEQVQFSGDSIPVVDLQGFGGPNHSDLIGKIGQACQEYGFFQIKNHGVSETLVDKMLNVAREFFNCQRVRD